MKIDSQCMFVKIVQLLNSTFSSLYKTLLRIFTVEILFTKHPRFGPVHKAQLWLRMLLTCTAQTDYSAQWV